jgi:Zn-dependent protease
MLFQFSKEEIEDLLIAWMIISLSFTFVLGGGFRIGKGFLKIFFFSLITVGLGFLLHEIAHKIVAQKYGFWAEFRRFDLGLIFALIFSLFGTVFAAPGAVMIFAPFSSKEENGKIALAGPLSNLLLATLFLFLSKIHPIFYFGSKINAGLAFFNLLPFPPLDGFKVISWSFFYWGITILFSLAIQFLI